MVGNSNANSGSAATSSWESSALHQLLVPDGYYTYLDIEKPNSNRHVRRIPFSSDPKDVNEQIDVDQVKRNYRKLSLKHHPDRRGGDAETFRVLARAKKVLTTPKLRAQYDLLGVDLEDDEHEHDHHDDEHPSNSGSSNSGGGNEKGTRSGKETDDNSTEDNRNSDNDDASGTGDTILSTIASTVLAFLLQLMVRLIVMGIVSCLISRYKLLVACASIFLLYVAYRVRKNFVPEEVKKPELLSFFGLMFGLWLMYFARRRGWSNEEGDGVPSFWLFWMGESFVMSLFLRNSFSINETKAIAGIAVFSSTIALFLRGIFWRYIVAFLMVGGVALISVILFPMLDMLLEEIVNDKMRKVGDKVRQSAEVQEAEMSRLRSLCRQLEIQQEQTNGANFGYGRKGEFANKRNAPQRQASLHEMD